MFLKVDNMGAERTSSGTLFQATGPAAQNDRLRSSCFVLCTNKYATSTQPQTTGISGLQGAEDFECGFAGRHCGEILLIGLVCMEDFLLNYVIIINHIQQSAFNGAGH